MRLKKWLLSGIALLALSSACLAEDFSFTGNFTNVNDVQLFTFTVGSGSDVVLRTYSYAGGVNAAGTVIARGGFDPILALFQGTGPSALEIGQNDDGGGFVPADSVTGAHYDTYLAVDNLVPGIYTVSVQDFANFAIGPTLGDGFNSGGLTGGTFIDATGHNRDGHWAFDVLGVESASTGVTPEPSTWMLLVSGLLALGIVVRRQTRIHSTRLSLPS